MVRLWEDGGLLWSVLAWEQLCLLILEVVIPGLMRCAKQIINKLPALYTVVVWSYGYVNGLNDLPDVQKNIWATSYYPKINKCMVALRYIKIADLPLKDGIIDYKLIQQTAQHAGHNKNLFLLCSALQHIYQLRLGCLKSSRTFPMDLGKSAKKLLRIQRQKFVPIMNWSLVLRQNIEWDKCLKAFKTNLH